MRLAPLKRVATPYGPARLVTPEAVVLHFETAGVGSRILATLLDLVLLGLLVFAGIFAINLVGQVNGTVARVLALVYFSFVVFAFPILFETLWRGRTLGKAALGLRVVTRQGLPVRFRHALVRSIFTMVDFWLTLCAAAMLSVLVSRDNQRLGDMVAGTIVLRERSAAGRAEAVRFALPYGYEGYAATLDVSGLTGEQYAAARSYLVRAAKLSPSVRVALANELATAVAARIKHVPPPGVTAEAFLACVAAVHQARAAPAVAADSPDIAAPWSPVGEAWAAPPVIAAPRTTEPTALADGFTPPA